MPISTIVVVGAVIDVFVLGVEVYIVFFINVVVTVCVVRPAVFFWVADIVIGDVVIVFVASGVFLILIFIIVIFIASLAVVDYFVLVCLVPMACWALFRSSLTL